MRSLKPLLPAAVTKAVAVTTEASAAELVREISCLYSLQACPSIIHLDLMGNVIPVVYIQHLKI